MSYGQEFLPPEEHTQGIPERIQYVRDHIDQPHMQAMVALGVASGFALALIGVNVMRAEAKTKEEKQAARNLPKLLGFAGLVYGTFYLLDVEKKWWRAESAIEEAGKWVQTQTQ